MMLLFKDTKKYFEKNEKSYSEISYISGPANRNI